jgi:hypothetical protein
MGEADKCLLGTADVQLGDDHAECGMAGVFVGHVVGGPTADRRKISGRTAI